MTLDQLRLWRLILACPTQSFRSYGIVKVNKDFGLDRLQQAFETVAQEYDVLRSRLVSIPGIAYPLLMEGKGSSVAYRDMGAFSSDADREIDRMGQELASWKFVFEEFSLIHVCFGRLESGGILWGLVLPAFLGDGSSVEELLKAVSSIASGMASGDARRVRERPVVAYRNVSRWRDEIMAAEEAKIGKLLWRERLASHSDAAGQTIVSDARIHQSKSALGIKRIAARIQTRDIVAEFAMANGFTARSYFFAAWYFLLWKLCDCPGADFHVAAQFDGRSMQDLTGAVGPLERLLPIGASINAGRQFRQLCDDLAGQFDQANEWQDCFSWSNFDDLDDSDAQIHSYDYCFEFFTPDNDAAGENGRWALMRRFSRCERYKLKLDVCYRNEGGGEIALHYDPQYFSQRCVQELFDTYRHFLEQVTKDDTVRLRDMQWSEAQRRGDSSTTDSLVAKPNVEYVVDRLRRMAAQYPDRIAFASVQESLSYARVDERSDALALLVRNQSLAPESCVAVIGATSFNTIIGFIAVLKAGHCFVHIDPEHPQARTLKVLRECGAKVLLLDGATTDVNTQTLLQKLCVSDEVVIDMTADRFEPGGLSGKPDRRAIHPEQLAYVAYTSGSTGDPNGVMISHGALANQIAWLAKSFGFSGDDSWLLKTPLGFDAAIWEWLTPLCVGAALVFGGQRLHLHPERIVKCVRDHKVTALQIVPNLLRTLIDEVQPGELAPLRYLFSGGEKLTADLCRAVSAGSEIALINLYGPTETTINATSWQAPRELGPLDETSIGSPVEGMKAYVLDKLGQRLPPHFAGELHLAGSGLARGYAKNPELTATHFVPSRHGDSQRMYRTGDRVFCDEYGKLFYQGRLDNQIKLRGYRIELGEIESILASHSGVKTAAACICAAAGKADDVRLIAYAVAKDVGFGPSAAELRDYLRDRVPEYMVPSLIILLDRLPLKSTGKVDRKVLQSQEFIALHQSDSYVAPQTGTQKKLCEIWQQILEVDAVGISDDFLRLGGQSLLVTRLIAHVRQSIGIEISPRLVFDFPVLRDFAEQIDRLQEG